MPTLSYQDTQIAGMRISKFPSAAFAAALSGCMIDSKKIFFVSDDLFDLPIPTSADACKVLTVYSDEYLYWATHSGGSSVLRYKIQLI